MSSDAVRVCEKFALSIPEAVAYFGIGEKKLRRMVAENRYNGCFIHNGAKVTVIRTKFEKFLESNCVI